MDGESHFASATTGAGRVEATLAPVSGNAGPEHFTSRQHSHRQHTRTDPWLAARRVISNPLKGHAGLYTQFEDNESFRERLSETVFAITYQGDLAAAQGGS